MVTAEDDDDSDNDCLYIDESPTTNQGTTSQPQDAAISTNSTSELTNPEVPIDYLPLMRNVEILKNIPFIPDVSKKPPKRATAKIACKDFSRKPFDTNEMLNSALYHHLTTDAMPPNKHMVTSNGLTSGNQNLKNLLDAPSRPPTNPYASLPKVHPQTETLMAPQAQNDPRTHTHMNEYVLHVPTTQPNMNRDAQNYPRTQPNMNGYAQNDPITQFNTNVYVQNDPRSQPNTNMYVQSDPRNQTNMNVYAQNGHQMDGNQMPIAQPSPNLPNKTSVIVPHPGNSAGGAMTYRHTNDQRPANLPITINGYQVENGSAPANQEAQISVYKHAETRMEFYGETTMNQGVGPYRTCKLTCPCRRLGVKSHSPLNPVPGRGAVSMPLNEHQGINPTFNHYSTNQGAPTLNPGHELMSSSSTQHQSMNPILYSHVTGQRVPALNPGHELMIPSPNPQHQFRNTLNSQPNSMDLSFHQHRMNFSMTSHHQSMSAQTLMSPQPTISMIEDPINRSPLTLQHQRMNPSLNPQAQTDSSRLPPCYSCVMGKPCTNNTAPSYLQPEVPITNSQTVPWNGVRQNYNRNGSIPLYPGYNSEQISTADYLATLRSQECKDATRDILGPPAPVNKKPRGPPKQRAKPVKKTKNSNASLAANCNEPMNNGASTSTLPSCSPAQSYPLPNWAAFGTQNAAPQKPTPTIKAKVSNVKKTQDKNIEMPHIDLTTDVTQKSNTDMTKKIMQAPLSIETHKQIFNERIDTRQTNVTTAAHNMNAIILIQDSSIVEGQSIAMTMNVNNNGTPTHLIEASTQQDTSSNDDNDVNQSQINTDQPWIDIKSDGAPIPLIMDHQDVSMDNNVETTIQPSVIQTTTKTVTKNFQSESFLQQSSDNIDIETAMALLHADTDEAPTNFTQNSKTLAKSTNAYELVSPTSVTMETTSHNIESNDIIMRTDTSNSEVHTNREVNINQIIENTVTVSIVKKIITNPNISLPKTETLLDILNKVHCAKEANKEENMEQTRTEDENKIKTTAVDDGSTKGIEEDDDQSKDVPHSKNDDRLIMARQNLARWSALEHENKNKRADYNTKTETDNTYHIEVITSPHGEYIAQVKIPLSDGSPVQQEEFNINCPSGKTTQIKNADSSEYNILPKLEIKIENHQDKSEVAESQEIKNTKNESQEIQNIKSESQGFKNIKYESQAIKNIKNEESESAIDEMLFFKFQINFFRLVQERLSENNQEVYAQKLHNAIHDLIILSDYEDSTADLKYECHECHNVTIYSPRQFYYNAINYLKSLLNSAYNCQLCLTFRKKYIDVLIRYVKRETSGANLNTSSKQIAENTEINDQKPDTKTDLINERQTHSKPELIDDESDSTNKKQKDCNVKEQGVVITADAPTSSKHVEINDQKKHNNKNTPVNQNQTSFVVKLPRHMLKESTVEALIQCKKSKSNDNKSDGDKNLNMVLHDNYGKGNNNSSDPRVKPTKETVTTTATVHGNKNISTSLANDNNKENHYSKRKTINTNKQKNTNTKSCSTNIQDNQERCANKRKSSSAENASSSNPDPQNINSNPPSNNNDANLESHSKKKKSIGNETNPELQKINSAVMSKIMEDSNTNHKRQSKKRKSTEIAPSTIPGTNTSDNIDDQNKNQDQHSKRKKSICTKTEMITSRGAQHSKTTSDNNDDNDRNHERSSKKRKSTSGEVAPTKNQNRNTNVSENNDKDHEAHSKRRKSISAESEIRANLNDCHNNCKNKERDCETKKNICGQITTPEDKENCNKDSATKNNEEHATRQPNASKNISEETTTNKDDESQKRKSVTASNNDINNSKEPCNPVINDAANNKKDNNEVRKSTDSETTTNKDTGRPKKQTTTGSNVTSTETTTNNHTENQQSIILKIFRDHVESITRKHNNEKRNNSVTEDEKASDKSAEKLNAKEIDELPRVDIPGKKEKKGKDERKVKKCIAKINDTYICKYCKFRCGNFTACENHLTNDHKIVNIDSNDYVIWTKCPYCTRDMIAKHYNKHLKDRHPGEHSRVINK